MLYLCLNFLCVLFFMHHLISEQLTILLYCHQSSREAYASGRELVSATAVNASERQQIQIFAAHQGKFWTKNQVFESIGLFPDVLWRRWPVMAVWARKFSQTVQCFHHVSFPKMFEWACKFLKLVKFSLIVWCYKHQLEQVSFLLLCCVDHHHNVHAKVFAWMQKLFSCWESLFHDLVVISSWWTKLIWSWLVSEFLSESLLHHLVQTFFKEPGQHPSDNFLCKSLLLLKRLI